MEKKCVQSIRWLLSLICFCLFLCFWVCACFSVVLLSVGPSVRWSVYPCLSVRLSIRPSITQEVESGKAPSALIPPFSCDTFLPFLPAAVGCVTLLLFGVCGVFAAPTSQLFISSFPCTRLFLPFSVSHRRFSHRYQKLKKDERKMKKRGKPCWIDPELPGFSPLRTKDAWNLVSGKFGKNWCTEIL